MFLKEIDERGRGRLEGQLRVESMARQAFVLARSASPWSKVVKTKSDGLAPEDWKVQVRARESLTLEVGELQD